jgi:hypothetical protein
MVPTQTFAMLRAGLGGAPRRPRLCGPRAPRGEPCWLGRSRTDRLDARPSNQYPRAEMGFEDSAVHSREFYDKNHPS